MADCQTYVKTLHHLDLHYPSLILIPDSSLGSSLNKQPASLLLQYIQDEFPSIALESVLRKYWNETVGASVQPFTLSYPLSINFKVLNSSISFASMTRTEQPCWLPRLKSTLTSCTPNIFATPLNPADILPSQLPAPYSNMQSPK